MKRILFLTLLFSFSTIFSAQENQSVVIDSKIAVNSNMDEMMSQFLELKTLSRQQCKRDSLRANEEAKFNLSYSLPLPTPAMEEDLFIAEQEFIQVLRENKIGYGGYIFGNCFGLADNCFQWEMNRIVELRFGKVFMENLKTAAVNNFIKNNPERIFEFEECDLESRYASAKTYEEMFSKTKTDYFKTFQYPKEFIFRDSNHKSSNVEVNFILDKKGKVSKLNVDLSLQEKKNYIYSSYLINSIKEFVNNSKWKSATYKGVPVISKMNVLIFYK